MGFGGAILGGIIGGMFGGWGGAIIGSLIGGAVSGSGKSGNNGGNGNDATQKINALRALFRSFGCLAKADGVVSQDEADYVSHILTSLNISDQNVRNELIRSFNEGKNTKDYGKVISEVEKQYQSTVYPTAMEAYCIIVLADGVISPEERDFLNVAERAFRLPGFSKNFFARYQGGQGPHSAPSKEGKASAEDYAILGITPSASDSEVKAAYRKKIMEFHPDKIQGKGLSDAFIAYATDQTNKINAAYDRICKTRGI